MTLKTLENTVENTTYIKSLPKVYIVGFWAKYGIREYHTTNETVTINNKNYPLVWNYNDHNGIDDLYELIPLCYVTTGQICGFFNKKEEAEKYLEMRVTEHNSSVKM